ncbi:GNAT family N-acetyltransferase [Metabacillus sp. GX 13764]|uniref:GNAT family N-acetyltransferase n=1 Tax=Metabacillus kandeliae TaxID=2900151 RepID=UPI001E49AA44|nr:GNAT family N-acetyltransferase [Metabacillus kandeliae]MCD7034013.1 GNAT family N-acetyltransferase [Metabacillus kandeliae]
MGIILRNVTEGNFSDVIALSADKPHPNGRLPLIFEKYTASNVYYIALASLKLWVNRVIYFEECPVGFAVHGFYKHMVPELIHLMIHSSFQNKGYGKAALPLLLAEMADLYGADYIHAAVKAENERGKKFLQNAGFQAEKEPGTYSLFLQKK